MVPCAPTLVSNHNPVLVLWNDAGKVAIFLSLGEVVGFDDSAHAAELIFKVVDALWVDDPI